MDKDTRNLLRLQDQKEYDAELFGKIKILADEISKPKTTARSKEIAGIKIVGMINKRKVF